MKTVTRAVLAEALHKKIGLSQAECASFVDSMLEEIIESLMNGDTVKLSSFGSFKVRKKKQRVGRNPKTKREAIISARRVATFHASQLLLKQVNAK